MMLEMSLFLAIVVRYFLELLRVNSNTVYTYSNHGDIAEWDIVGKLDSELKEKCYELLQTDLR